MESLLKMLVRTVLRTGTFKAMRGVKGPLLLVVMLLAAMTYVMLYGGGSR